MSTKPRIRGCDHCGQAYEYQRSTSRFCSDSCRVSQYQRGGDIQQKYRRITQDIYYLVDKAKSHKIAQDVNMMDKVDNLRRMIELLDQAIITQLTNEHFTGGGLKLFNCADCGQIYYGFDAPDKCDFCGKQTKWMEKAS